MILSAPGAPTSKMRVTARGRDLQDALGLVMAADLGHVNHVLGLVVNRRTHVAEGSLAAQEAQHLAEALGIDGGNLGVRGLGAVFEGHDDRMDRALQRAQHREDAARTTEPPFERQLPEEHMLPRARQGLDLAGNRDGDREVEGAARRAGRDRRLDRDLHAEVAAAGADAEVRQRAPDAHPEVAQTCLGNAVDRDLRAVLGVASQRRGDANGDGRETEENEGSCRGHRGSPIYGTPRGWPFRRW